MAPPAPKPPAPEPAPKPSPEGVQVEDEPEHDEEDDDLGGPAPDVVGIELLAAHLGARRLDQEVAPPR